MFRALPADADGSGLRRMLRHVYPEFFLAAVLLAAVFFILTGCQTLKLPRYRQTPPPVCRSAYLKCQPKPK
jgi:hypothetical protein